MSENEQRDPLERLRAADPAAGVEPRAGFADEVIARAAADAASVDAPVADLADERARRRSRWVQVAAVAASVLVVGAAGYGLGATTGGSTPLADGAAPPISLDGGGAGTSEQAIEPAPSTGDLKVGAADARAMIAPWGYGRTHFSATGLSTDADTATGYAFDARAGDVEARVAALAAALGVEGDPVLADGAWTVGPQDGTAPSLRVSLDGTLGFSYSDPRIDPWRCDEGADACEPTGTLPGEDAAIDALRTLLTSAGRDAGAFEFTSETWEGAVTRAAQAWPVVDGQRVDQPWSLELADEGIVSAYGPLADLVSLGDYAVVSEQEAFDRLSDPRFGAQGTVMPFAADTSVEAPAEWVPPTEPPAAPAPGAAVAWPVTEVELVEARLGLATQWQPDGSVVVVPAYAFTDSDGGTWSVIAVADDHLDFAGE